VQAPSIKGWRVAWTPDLHGLMPVDKEVARVAHDALRVLRSLGAQVEAACSAFSEVYDIVRGTCAVAMVALHADKLPEWRERMQKDLVQDVEQGLTVTAREITHGKVLRSVLWHRVRAVMATRDLLVLPTVAVPPFPVEPPYPGEINGQPIENYTQWLLMTYIIMVTCMPAISVPCGFTRDGLPVGLQIVGRRRQDTVVLQAAAAFEAAAPWDARIPPVVPHSLAERRRLGNAAGHYAPSPILRIRSSRRGIRRDGRPVDSPEPGHGGPCQSGSGARYCGLVMEAGAQIS
jgi:amidase